MFIVKSRRIKTHFEL